MPLLISLVSYYAPLSPYVHVCAHVRTRASWCAVLACLTFVGTCDKMRQHMANYLFLARTQGVPVVLGKHDPHLARTFGLTLSGPEMGKLQWVSCNG